MKYLAFCLPLLFIVSCSSRQAAETPEALERYHIHTVAFSGETLGAISSWYTGKASNWEQIVKHNSSLEVTSLQIGEQVLIPESLLVRTARLPETLVKKNNPPAFIHPARLVQRRSQIQKVDRHNVNWEEVGDYLYPDELSPPSS